MRGMILGCFLCCSNPIGFGAIPDCVIQDAYQSLIARLRSVTCEQFQEFMARRLTEVFDHDDIQYPVTEYSAVLQKASEYFLRETEQRNRLPVVVQREVELAMLFVTGFGNGRPSMVSDVLLHMPTHPLYSGTYAFGEGDVEFDFDILHGLLADIRSERLLAIMQYYFRTQIPVRAIGLHTLLSIEASLFGFSSSALSASDQKMLLWLRRMTL